MAFTRYAVYYTPPEGALAEFGAAWLGWDLAAGVDRGFPDVEGLPRPLAEITRAPRKYGFHATLKPPFRLAAGQTPEALRDAVSDLAAGLVPAALGRLRLSTLGRFIALVPERESAAIDALAARCVVSVDRFRAAGSGAELSRRRAAGLTPGQEEQLRRWGYPYVMDEFRFHMTLTGPLAPDEHATVHDCLASRLAPLLRDPLTIDGISLVGEGADGHFRHIHRYALSA